MMAIERTHANNPLIGDAIAIMKTLDRDSYGAVITSPPYNIGVDYGDPCVNDNKTSDDYATFTQEWVKQALRVAPVAVINFGAPTSKPDNLARFMIALGTAGIIQAHIVWVKSISTDTDAQGHFKPVNSKRYLNNLHESIFIVSRDGNYALDRLAVGVPFTDKTNIGRFGANKADIRCRGNIWLLPYKTKTSTGAHPAQYPRELAEMMIKIVAPASVLDPFMGSGTTQRAADRLGVACQGIDIRDWDKAAKGSLI